MRDAGPNDRHQILEFVLRKLSLPHDHGRGAHLILARTQRTGLPLKLLEDFLAHKPLNCRALRVSFFRPPRRSPGFEPPPLMSDLPLTPEREKFSGTTCQQIAIASSSLAVVAAAAPVAWFGAAYRQLALLATDSPAVRLRKDTAIFGNLGIAIGQARWISMAQRVASTAVANSTTASSPVVLTI